MNTDTMTNRRTPAAVAASTSLTAPSPSIAFVASAPAAPTRAGAEDDRVSPLQRLHQLLGRGRDQVEHQRLDPGRLEVGRLPGGADQPDRLVPPRGEQRTEPQPDLAMTSGDDGSHALHRASSNARSKNGVRWSP